ncbi:hypothetical protein I0C86_21675 [Plantactinospora sp. S1510]|uniref:Lipoprotein n=1 Tax=Plantactinospora alkalitolerans TaxID=2789879 RepID=A0ABS0GZC7_9ACTN|nr:hypothetical protein [Plantactinospora alkalitolerans]MBF9131552.1 hypothetical protein [Plantactinospora alkalitolerans]
MSSRRPLAVALVAIGLCGGCGKEELPKLPLGTSVTIPVSVRNAGDGAISITPYGVWRGEPEDLIGLNVRHNDGTEEPAPSGTPYYVPTSFENQSRGIMPKPSIHRWVRAVDTDGEYVEPLDDPQWQPGKGPCEGFTFREGDSAVEVLDLCLLFVLPEGAELDYLRTAAPGRKRVAWAVPRDHTTAPPRR